MNSKPLSYDCLKTVLLHMDAHTRINVSSRIPSIRKAEKSVPLKIKYLCFGFYSIGIDNTEYQVGIFRDYGALKTPNYVEKCNEEGGSYYDIDEDGFEDSSTMEQKLLPEDIAIKPLEIKEPLPRNDDTIRQKEAEIIDLKNEISELDTQYKKYLSDHGFETIEELAEQLHSAQERNDEPLYQTLSSAFSEMRFRNAWIMSRLNDIDKIRHYIQCYNDFRNKISPPYKSYIHLTASQMEDLEEGRIGEQIERVEYNRLLPFALRAVSDFIFKGRRHPVYVESIFIEQQNIIRAPCDLKLKIRNVDLFFESPGLASSALKPIIHCSTFPLKELKVRGFFPDPVINSNHFQCEMAKDAEKLSIDFGDNNIVWLPILLALHNKNVEKTCNNSLEVDDYVALIRAWAVHGKTVGTVFTFHLARTFAGQQVLDRVAEEHQHAVKRDRCVKVPISNNFSQILVTIRPNKDPKTNFLCEFFLELKVVHLGDG
ncbi:hypothetical protein CAEBREN_17484 [Caenorhabditis brenneri]|uniref:Uncharacterized protein n=1 Tax=Caenorhabditis brenneri TaxID=135651 RepID=G0MMI5_CAEBE|nr:hypothetical protein CAEBREN_17484 [Caenorhabditis brenneri]